MLPISLIIPAKAEADNIGHVLDRCGHVAEVIVVTGDAATADVAKSYGVKVAYQVPSGKGAAMRYGASLATQSHIMFIDADGSMNPYELAKAYDLFLEGAEVVKGSRKKGGSDDLTAYRMLGNFFLTVLFNILFRTHHTDLCYGYLGATKEALDRMGLTSVGFEIESEIVARTARLNLRLAEFASHESSRLNGESNLRPIRDGLRILREIMALRLAW